MCGQSKLDVSEGAIYRADVYCGKCAAAICAELDAKGETPADLSNERTWDSDAYPKPCNHREQESDGYQHCGRCRAFLDNPLTTTGIQNVADALAEYADTGRGNPEVLDQWSGALCLIDRDELAQRAIIGYCLARDRDSLCASLIDALPGGQLTDLLGKDLAAQIKRNAR